PPEPLPDPDPEHGHTEDNDAPRYARLKELRTAQEFVYLMRHATLEASGMSAESIYRLRNPRQQTPTMNRYQRAGLRMFLARGDASEANYADHCTAMVELHPEDNNQIPTYEQVKRLVAELTGIEAIIHDMCVDSCVGYTGPFSMLEHCPFCNQSRYDLVDLRRGKKIARRTFHTYPLGPQLQAMSASPENAQHM
ncbi:hypothetical protein C2E23DRAFT_724983, partial [Lenzites betulinus]